MDGSVYSIRDFLDADFDALARIESQRYPDHPISADRHRHFAGLTEGSGRRAYRLAAVEISSGSVVAAASLEQLPMNFHPRKHWVFVDVDREHGRRGIGGELYRRIEAEAHRREAIGLWSAVRSDDDAAVHFFHRQGFVEKRRVRDSRLELGPDAARGLPDRTESLRALGIECTTLAAEGSDREDVRRGCYRLYLASSSDMPTIGVRTPISYEEYVHLDLAGPGFDPEATFLAKAGDIYVGVTTLERQSTQPELLQVGYTGTDPDFRGRGVATELKRRAIAFARDRGYARLETSNDYANSRIWAINDKVGFRTVRTYLDGEKSLSPTS